MFWVSGFALPPSGYMHASNVVRYLIQSTIKLESICSTFCNTKKKKYCPTLFDVVLFLYFQIFFPLLKRFKVLDCLSQSCLSLCCHLRSWKRKVLLSLQQLVSGSTVLCEGWLQILTSLCSIFIHNLLVLVTCCERVSPSATQKQ